MNRRETALALLALAALGPRIATAQTSSRIPTIGYLALAPAPSSPWDATLKSLGWIEGKNVAVQRSFAEGNVDRLPALAEELVRRQVDIIFTHGPDATVAAAVATKTIPIVFFGAAYPVEQGLVDSLARPGRNVTGVAWHSAFVKQIEFVKEIAPRAKRVAHFILPTAMRTLDGRQFAGTLGHIESTAKAAGIEMQAFKVVNKEDFDDAFKAIIAWRTQALILYATPPTVVARKKIVDFASANRLPTVGDWRGFPDAGGLLSYGPVTAEMIVQSVRQVDRILRGARPADLPVELPTRYEFVINQTAAAGIGIKVPKSLLARADQVIQ
jgi:putative ABC transport system substrate-binding protein